MEEGNRYNSLDFGSMFISIADWRHSVAALY